MNIVELGIGKISLRDMCYWLDQRCYSKELAIEYIKKTYDIDVTKEIEEYALVFENSKNIFDYFEQKHPPKKEDDGSREWFNYYGRNRYLKFYNCFVENDNVVYDEILNFCQHSSVIHHIFPLVYGGKSNPQNLIGVIGDFHEVLHKNPLEHIEKYCFQSVDYLRALIKSRQKYIFEKYKLEQYKDNIDFRLKVLNLAIDKEMNIFYNDILKEYQSQERGIA